MTIAAAPHGRRLGRAKRPGTRGLVTLLTLALAAAALAALAVGARGIPPDAVLAALFAPDYADRAHVVVRELRLPRLAAGLLVGAALGIARAQMQALTRNPLADSGLLGVNAGTAFAAVLAIRLGFGPGLAVRGLSSPGRARRPSRSMRSARWGRSQPRRSGSRSLGRRCRRCCCR
jgi:iron complex transport system permease protein